MKFSTTVPDTPVIEYWNDDGNFIGDVVHDDSREFLSLQPTSLSALSAPDVATRASRRVASDGEDCEDGRRTARSNDPRSATWRETYHWIVTQSGWQRMVSQQELGFMGRMATWRNPSTPQLNWLDRIRNKVREGLRSAAPPAPAPVKRAPPRVFADADGDDDPESMEWFARLRTRS
jgi:hypothetical protein